MSQRIKGNAKPSNSERASRLLQNRGFVSFSEASQALSEVYSSKAPNTDASSSYDYDICPEFQVMFKHMAKKDINTKLKALKDFVVLCRSKDKNDLLKIAKFWYRIYRKLANTIDWRIRADVHNAHCQFLLAFDRDTIINNLQSVSCSGSSESSESNDVSFQNLVTMPAVMWTACFDSYTQPAEAAQQTISQLYRDPDQRAQFLIDNYEAILNYCIYCIFEKVPIGLFYSTSLPSDSVKVFEEHFLVTSLFGLSSMVNELLCYHHRIDSLNDESRQNQVFTCLEKIFLRLNSEFVKCKGLLTPETKPVIAEDVDGNVTENGDFQLLSKKEKKKLKKEANQNNKSKDDSSNNGRGGCKFWSYPSADNGSVRVAFFQALNSLARLTTFFADPKLEGDLSYYDKLNISTRLWFKLYKSNFFEITFKSFADHMPEVRGLSWIIGSHLLANRFVYNPWSVVNMDKWLEETLQPFVANGLKTPNGVTDFALFKIGLDSHREVFKEFFIKKHEHLSALLITTGNYSQMDILAKVKLVIVFVDAFNQHTSCLKIVNILLDCLKRAFTRAILSGDMHFLVELYFNLIYYLVQREDCDDKAQLESFVETLVQQNLYSLLISSFDSSKSLLADSQLYVNLLLLAHHTQQSQSTCGNFTNLLILNLTKLYERLMVLVSREIQSVNNKFQIDSKMNLLFILRCITDATYFAFNGYFSPNYYYTRKDSNYPKRVLRLMKNPKINSGLARKRVLFQDTESDLSIDSSEDYWADKWKVSNFNYSLVNPDYESSQHKSGPFSLIDSLPSLKKHTVQITADLFKLIEFIMKEPGGTQKDETFLLIYHLQLILRSFTANELDELNKKLQNEVFPVQYIIKWISYLFTSCSDLTDHRFVLSIGTKICDLYIVILSKFKEPEVQFRSFCQTLDPFAFCLMARHLDHLNQDDLPLSEPFSSLVCKLNLIIESIYVKDSPYLQRLMMIQIENLFANGFSPFDADVLLNLLLMIRKNKPLEDSAIRLINQVLAKFYQSFCRLQVEEIANSTFGIEYPLLSSELYQILFDNPNQVATISDFKATLSKFVTMVFVQMFSSLQNGASLNVFVENCFTFLKVTFTNMFQHFAFYENILVTLLQKLIHFVIDRVTEEATWNVDNFKLINEYISNFLKLLFVNYEKNLPDDALDVKQFYTLQVELYRKIIENTPFNCDDAILCLYAIQSQNPDKQLFASVDLFSNSKHLAKLIQVNNSCQLNKYIEKHMNRLEYSIYLHSALANIIKQLLKSIYFDSNFNKILPADDPTIHGTDFEQSQIYRAIQTQFLYLYRFQSFSKLYFTGTKRKDNEKEQKRELIYHLLDSLQDKIQSIYGLISKFHDHNMTVFCSFIVGLQNNSIKLPSLLFAQYYFKYFCPEKLASVLNQIDRPDMFNCSYAWNRNDLIWLYLANTESIESITKIVQNAIASIQTVVVEEKDQSEVVKPVINWSTLDLAEVHRTLLILNFALTKTSRQNVDDLKKELKEFALLASNNELSTLFTPNLLSFDSLEFFTFVQFSYFINKSSELFNISELSTHISFLLSLYQPFIPVLFAALPEGLEKGVPHQLSSLLWSSLVLDPFRTIIICGKSLLRLEDESYTVVKDSIWNFLVINSYNMLMPVFAVMARTLDSNFLERSFRQRLINVITLLDSKILIDVALFEPNEFLLMQPTQVEKRIDVMAEYLEHLTSSELKTLEEGNQRVMQFVPIDQSSNYYRYIFEHITPLLYEGDYDLSQSAYYLLCTAIEAAPWHCTTDYSAKKDNEDENNLTISGIDEIQDELHLGPPQFLSDLLDSLDKIVYCTLMEYEFGEPVAIEPHVDVHHFAMAYLFTWLLYLRLVTRFLFKGEVNGEISSDLVSYLTEKGFYARLLNNLYSLMPNEEPRLDKEPLTVNRFDDVLSDFCKLRQMCGEPRGDSLAQLSLCVYYHTVSQVPNLLRSWYNRLKHVPRQIVDNFTTRYFSRLLIEKEIHSVEKADKNKFGNIMIYTSIKTNEISAVYSLKEIEFGIKFNFQDNYPLTSVSIQCFNRSGVSQDRCRKWIQRLTIFFNKMNCSILEGIIQLRPNMDKFFEGIEECMICLFVLYGVTAQLPKFKCPQCRKKFHSTCIRKWFQTHHNSTCPQCKFEFQ